jgi:hypothetical protein
MHRIYEESVQGMHENGVRTHGESGVDNVAAEFLPAKSASETFAAASEASPIDSDFRVVRRCSIWKS